MHLPAIFRVKTAQLRLPHPSFPTHCPLSTLYKTLSKRTTNTDSPWRWQLKYFPKRWIRFKTRRGPSPKFCIKLKRRKPKGKKWAATDQSNSVAPIYNNYIHIYNSNNNNNVSHRQISDSSVSKVTDRKSIPGTEINVICFVHHVNNTQGILSVLQTGHTEPRVGIKQPGYERGHCPSVCSQSPYASMAYANVEGNMASIGIYMAGRFKSVGSDIKSEVIRRCLSRLITTPAHISGCYEVPSPPRLSSPVVFNLFCSRTPRYNFSSTLYPQSCWYIMKVIHII
jgi:hypothetical protein